MESRETSWHGRCLLWVCAADKESGSWKRSSKLCGCVCLDPNVTADLDSISSSAPWFNQCESEGKEIYFGGKRNYGTHKQQHKDRCYQEGQGTYFRNLRKCSLQGKIDSQMETPKDEAWIPIWTEQCTADICCPLISNSWLHLVPSTAFFDITLWVVILLCM